MTETLLGGTAVPDSMSGSNRRRWLGKAIPVGMAVLLAVGVTAGHAMAATAPATPAGPTTSLVAPTGHYQAGTIRLHLVDHSRIDPTSPTHSVREIMVQVWYPATATRVFPPTPYLTPLAAAHFLASFNLPADTLANSQHETFSDGEELEPELATALGLTPDQVEGLVGTINPKTAVTDERAYIQAFFDRYLRGRDNHLLDGPSPRFPDISFEP